MPLTASQNVGSFRLAAGEAFVVQMSVDGGEGADEREFVMSVYGPGREIVETIDGVQNDELFDFVRPGSWSEGLLDHVGLKIEIAERLSDGRAVIATPSLAVDLSAMTVADLSNSVIARTAILITANYNPNGLVVASAATIPYDPGASSTPGASFTQQPTVSPSSGSVGQVFTATPGAATVPIDRREWRSGGSVVGTNLESPSAPEGVLDYQEFAGSASSDIVSVTVSAVVAPAAFTMTQLGDANRVYQRSTDTGGGQGKGTGSIDVSVNVTSIGVPRFRIRSSDGTTILQAATPLPAFTATGAQTLTVSGVDARIGWFFVDLSGNGSTWKNGTTLVGMGALGNGGGQSLMARMFTSAGDPTSMTAAGVTPDPNTCVYALPGDGSNPQMTLAWRLWDATSTDSSGQALNSAGGAQLAKAMVAQLGVNVGIIGHPIGGTPIVTHTMAGTNGASIRQIIRDAGGFEFAFLMIGHTDARDLVTGGSGARDFKGGLSAYFQLLTAANPRGANYRTVVWAIPNCDPAQWGNAAQKNEIRRAMYEFARSSTATALMTSCRYVNSYTLTLSVDNVHQGQVGAVQIANIVATALSTGNDAPAGDDTLAATPVSTGTATSATYGTAGKFQAASLDGGYVITQSPVPSAGGGTVGFWYRGTPAGNSVAFTFGAAYLQVDGNRWKWHAANGAETTATTGPLIGTDSTTDHYVSVDFVTAAPDGSGGRVEVRQDGVTLLTLPGSAAGAPGNIAESAIRTYANSAGGFMINVPASDWRGYSKAMGAYVPTAALSASEPFLFVGFQLNGNAIAVA